MKKTLKFVCIMLTAATATLLLSCKKTPAPEESPVTLGAPMGLHHERSTTFVTLKWSAGDLSTEYYEIELSETADFTSVIKYTGDLKCYISIKLGTIKYSTTYHWRIRSSADDEMILPSEWVSSQFTTIDQPNTMAYVGTWVKDPEKDVEAIFTILSYDMPLGDFMPDWDGSDELFKFELTQHEEYENKLRLNMDGLLQFMPVRLPEGEEIILTCSDKQIVSYYHSYTTEQQVESQLEYSFGEGGLALKDQPWFSLLPAVGAIDLESVVIYKITMTVKSINIEGRLDEDDKTKAAFTIAVASSASLETNITDPLTNMMLNTALGQQAINTTIQCIKQ